MTEVTWQELKDLRDSGKLVAGMKYRMIDYDTYTSQADTESAMHPFDLILTALDNKTLSEECSAIQSARDVDGYFANSNLGAWKVWYCLDNDTSRFIWAASKGVVCRPEPEISFHLNYFGDFEWNEATYTAYRIDYGKLAGIGASVYMYALYSNSVPQVGDIPTYVLIDGTAFGEGFIDQTTDMGEMFVVLVTSEIDGKGVIYRLVDEYNNDICYDFKNIVFIHPSWNGGTYTAYTFYSASGSRADGSIEGLALDNSIKLPSILGLPKITLGHESTGDAHLKYNIHFINSPECFIYVSDGGNYSNCTFENCRLTNFGSGRSNYSIKIERCYVKDCSGDLDFDKTKKNFINVEIIGVSNVSALEGRTYDDTDTRLLRIRQKADGTVYSYTDEDIFNAINS